MVDRTKGEPREKTSIVPGTARRDFRVDDRAGFERQGQI